jgi:hypothetical protein
MTFSERGNLKLRELKVMRLFLAFGDRGKGRMEYSDWKRRVSFL